MDGVGQLQRMVCPACNGRYEGGQFCAKDGTPLVKDKDAGKGDLVGQVLADRYRIVKLLGEGGMGQVYEAQHVNINKKFAIKLLRPEIVSNAEAVQRFRQEAWSASSIGHDNIIEIDDFATLPNGSVYLAMEYLAGGSLAERMKLPPPLELGEALDIFVQVARGLSAAHDKAIIHRDMKPENIFLAEKQSRVVVKILDFGIAKVSGAEGSHSLTRTGAIFGTPHYMSPEQALGKQLDHRSDIYSVGVIMYEVFTGRVPFEAESFMGILTKHITSEPRRPTEVAPDRQIPEEIEMIIMKAMAKDSADRYASMIELQNDLISVMQMHSPHLLSPTGTHLAARAVSQPVGLIAGRQPTGQKPIAPTMVAAGAMTPQSPPRASGAVAATILSGTGSQPALGAGSQPFRTAQPTPSQPFQSQTGAQSVAMDAVVPYAFPDGEKKKGKGLGLILGVVGVMLLGGGAAAFVILKKPDAGTTVVPPIGQIGQTGQTGQTGKPTDPKPVLTPVDAPPVPRPATPEGQSVIVDSLPPGAKILKDGTPIGETPDTVKVDPGATVNVVLRKDGFIDEPVVVDPSKGRKLLVKLDRTHAVKPGVKSHAPKVPVYSSPTVKLPAPPPVPPPTPTVAQPAKPPVKHKPPADPYERLDDAPSKSKDVLNPY
jgi:serine/threonine protein kinase